MKTLVKQIVVGVAALCGFASYGDIYVDCQAPAAGADGTAEHPYPTIQAGVTAAGENAHVWVAKGVYDSGETTHRDSLSRLAILNKTGVVIEATDGKEQTFIVGKSDPSGDLGNGPNAVRCVSAESCTDVILRGFTLTGGHTLAADVKGGYGGAVLDVGTSWSVTHAGIWLEDCVVSNCAAHVGGAFYGGGAVRCLIRDNAASHSSSVSHRGTFVHCVMSANAITNNNTYAMMYSDAVSCTFTGNTSTRAAFGGGNFYNSITELSGVVKELETGHITVSHSVDATTAAHGPRQLVAPATGDYRLNSNSDAIGAGDASLIATVTAPSGIDLYKDFSGQTIPSAGSIDAGAIQGSVTVASGSLRFESDYRTPLYINGIKNCPRTYVHALTYPVQYRVVPTAPAGQAFFRYNRDGDARGVYPNFDGGYWMLPPRDPAAEITNKLALAKAVFYVDAKTGSLSGDGSSSSPFATLQQAADACAKNWTLVLVRDGTYATGGEVSAQYGNSRLGTSTSYDMCFRSVNGPEYTHIVGAASATPFDDENYPGCGEGAYRCVRLHGGSAIQGFTLRDGHVLTNMNASSTWKKSGAAVLGDSAYGQILDCVISNTVSAQGATYNALSLRCRYANNRSIVWLQGNTCRSAFSYYSRNTIAGWDYTTEGVLGGAGEARFIGYNNTVWGAEDARVSGSGSTCYNTILRGGSQMYGNQILYGTIAWKYGWSHCTSPFVTIDPLFMNDGSVSDCSLSAFSPAKTNGLELTSSDYGAEFIDYALGDVNGKALYFDAKGAPAVGADQVFLPGLRIEAAAGGLTLDGAVVGENTLAMDAVVTVSAGAGTRPCLGFILGSVTNLFAETPSLTLTAAQIGMGGTATLQALYTTDWYISPEGDDAATGFSPSAPKNSFAALMPLVASGDTVHAAPGVYSNKVTEISGQSVGARLAVPEGVTVVSDDGAEATTILGGENIRCVYLNAHSKIQGFTLSGGRGSSTAGGNDALGGAILGVSEQGYDASYGIEAVSCVITNCACPNGVVCRVRLVDSRLVGNVAGDDLVRQSSLFGCFADRNTATVIFTWGQNMVGCTLGPNNFRSDGETLSNGFGSPACGTQGASHIFNTLSCLPLNPGNNDMIKIRNAVVRTGSYFFADKTDSDETLVTAAADKLVLNADGTPVIGTTPGIDAGNAALENPYYDSDFDLNGNQRVMNGTLDIGAFEADWRERYAQRLHGGDRVEIASASPAVVDDPAHGCVVISNGVLAANWAAAAGGGKDLRQARVSVSGAGTLTVRADDAVVGTVTAADGEVKLSYPSADDVAMTFSFDPGDGTGCAKIRRLRASTGDGLMILLR